MKLNTGGSRSRIITVLVADSNPSLRRLLRLRVGQAEDISVIAEAEQGQEAVEQCVALQPNVALIAEGFSDLSAASVANLITERAPRVQVIVLDAYGDSEEPVKWSGAKNYFIKDVSPEILVHAIRRVVPD